MQIVDGLVESQQQQKSDSVEDEFSFKITSIIQKISFLEKCRIFIKEQPIRQGFKKKLKKIVEFSTKGRGGVRMGRFSTKKKNK